MLSSQLALKTFIFLIANGITVLAAIGPVADFTIVNQDIAPDGYIRSMSIADGMNFWDKGTSIPKLERVLPGPLIQGTKGDTFSINVLNQLSDSSLALDIAIHWHGILQQNTNYVDGIPGVTQCPIIPMESFLYQFNTGEQTGTFMYRGYSMKDPIDGVTGPLVIYDPDDPHRSLYDVDNEDTIVTLADHYHSKPKALMTSYLSATSKGGIPTPNGGLINGKGRYLNGPSTPLSVTNVIKASRYRLRVANIGTATAFQFSIDGHKLTVIEVDGISVQPHTIDRIRVDVGQRYSVILEANQPIGNYWMRAVMDTTCFSDPMSVDPLVLGILRYAGAPLVNPGGEPTSIQHIDLNHADLHPLVPSPVPGNPIPGGADIQVVLNMAYNDATFLWTVNGTSWEPSNPPTLLKVLNGESTFPDAVILSSNSSVELTINNNFQCPQPFHLNGYQFHVVSSDGANYNFDDPIIRDTVTVAANSKVVLRIFTDNPGIWALHSQNQWHRSGGLLTQFIVDQADIPVTVHPSTMWDGLCPAYSSFVQQG